MRFRQVMLQGEWERETGVGLGVGVERVSAAVAGQ